MGRSIKVISILAIIFFCNTKVYPEPAQKTELPQLKIDENNSILGPEQNNSLLFSDGKDTVLITSMKNLEFTGINKENWGASPKFIIFTHVHNGEDKNLGMLEKKKSTIIFQENSFKRLSKPDAYLNSAITFGDRFTIYTENEEIHLIHPPAAHTDGDVIVYLKNANILYTGNTFYPGSFPYIDIDAGGSVRGYLESLNNLLSISDKNTVIIPGKGPVSNRKKLEEFQKMFKNSKNRIELLTNAGKSLRDILNEKPLDDFVEVWEKGNISSQDFIKNLFLGIKKKN